MKKSVRMLDIAQQLGISTVSVSKALAGKPGVSEEMRTKVIALARQMGYTGVRVRYEPGLTGNIGVLVSDQLFSENTFYADLYRELVLCSRAAGFSCIIEIISREAEQTAAPPPLVEQQRVDGIIFMGELSPAYLEATAAIGLPCLALDFRIPGLQIDSIRRDNVEGGFLLTKHLLSAGYKRIGFVGNIDHSDSILERYQGYQWALCRSGIEPRDEWLWRDQGTAQESFPTFSEQLEAFVCSSHEAAFHLINAWQRTRRRDTPEPILTCFDDFRLSVRFKPQLTIYEVDTKQMADAAVRQIVQKIRGDNLFSTGCVIPGRIFTSK